MCWYLSGQRVQHGEAVSFWKHFKLTLRIPADGHCRHLCGKASSTPLPWFCHDDMVFQRCCSIFLDEKVHQDNFCSHCKNLGRNLKEKFGLFVDFEFLTEMGSWGTDYLIPVGLRKILQQKVVENGVRKKRPRTGISPGNARDAIILCAFKFAPSRHALDLHTFLRLTRALCRSLVVDGSVVRPWFFVKL